MFGFFKKMFVVLSTSIVNGYNQTKCVSLNNQQCMTQPTLINLIEWLQSRVTLLSVSS